MKIEIGGWYIVLLLLSLSFLMMMSSSVILIVPIALLLPFCVVTYFKYTIGVLEKRYPKMSATKKLLLVSASLALVAIKVYAIIYWVDKTSLK